MDAVQQAAVSIISQVLNGRNLNHALTEVINLHPEYTSQQRGAVQDLCYGTLRHFGQLSAILHLLLNKPIQDLQIQYLLLIALYQLHYSKAAQHAVVDFAVNSVRKNSPSATGLVNAVLRNFLRNKEKLVKKADLTEEGHYSYPLWWIKAVQLQYKESAEDILTSSNLHPPMILRVNHRKIKSLEYLKLLEQKEMQAQLVAPDAILLQQPLPVDKLPGFKEGMVSVQDAGAQYAAHFLDIHDGMRVLDACAAPGGKSAHLLELAKIDLISLDNDSARLERVRENMHRLQLSATLLEGDAAQPADWWDGIKFQRILADVPCSATGVVRRHPDIKWLRRPTDIDRFAQQQLKILNALWLLLETGGKLLYATCSIFNQENQQVIYKFMLNHDDATQLQLIAPDMTQGQLLPSVSHDGFFYALLQKQK